MRIFSPAGHITEDSLALHSLNDLTECQAQRVEEHLNACANCNKRFRDTRDFVTLVRTLARGHIRRAGVNCSIGAIRLRTTANGNGRRITA